MSYHTSWNTCLYHTPDWLVTYPLNSQPVSVLWLSWLCLFSFILNRLLLCLLLKCCRFPQPSQYTILSQCAQSLSDFNTNGFNYLLCAHGSQVVSWLHPHTSNCLRESTVWISLGHYKLRMPIMNSSSFLQPPPPPPKFSISMKGRTYTQ